MKKIVAMLTPILIGFGIKLLKVFLIWVIGRWVSKRVVKLARTIMEKHAVNLSIRTFVASLVDVVALIIILIFVRKEKELQYKTMDIISIILNFVICFTVVPCVTIAGVFIDINGGGPELYRQILYFIPAFMILSIAASLAFRRMGEGKKSLIAGLTGPAVFALYLIVCSVSGLL